VSSTFTRGNPLHARLYDAICGWEERHGLYEWRLQLVEGISGDVLEIGTGTGRNLPHYAKGTRVFASEFDPVMLAAAISRATNAQAGVELLLADAMRLSVKDASVDWVVIGLALCSIPHPDRALGEVKRVLKKRGRLRFVEHVRDDPGTRRARVQDAINPAWRFISGGCNCNRRTEDLVKAEGFRVTEIHRFKLGMAHVAPHIMGEATPI
jgi:ubiquinone/menaquinone biosynthesis C-methylase UbiE